MINLSRLGRLFILPPLIITVLWLRSGREILSKPLKTVEVRTHDAIFGDDIQYRLERGPIAGYYVGLDAVVLTTLLCSALGGVYLVAVRRLKRYKVPSERPIAHGT